MGLVILNGFSGRIYGPTKALEYRCGRRNRQGTSLKIPLKRCGEYRGLLVILNFYSI